METPTLPEGNARRHQLATERQRHWRDDPTGKRQRIIEITRLLNGNAADVTVLYDRARTGGLYGHKRRQSIRLRDILRAEPHFKLGRAVSAMTPVGFLTRTHVRCGDCDLREALASDGHVLRVNGHSRSHGCETCEGTGSVAAPTRLDTYAEAA